MSLAVSDFLAFSFVGFSLVSAIFVGPVLLLMHILMPKKVLQNYFKPPFFSPLRNKAFFWGALCTDAHCYADVGISFSTLR